MLVLLAKYESENFLCIILILDFHCTSLIEYIIVTKNFYCSELTDFLIRKLKVY